MDLNTLYVRELTDLYQPSLNKTSYSLRELQTIFCTSKSDRVDLINSINSMIERKQLTFNDNNLKYYLK